jgi:hypothetical protein
MAVSREDAERGLAGILALPVDMGNLQLVSMLEEPSARGTAPSLPFAPGGQAGPAHRVPSLSLPPVHPLPVVRTPLARARRGPQTRGVPMGSARRLTRTGGWRGTHASGFPVGPVSVVDPSRRLLRVAPACPGAQGHPGETIPAPQGCVTYPGALVIGPTAECGVALVEPGRLGPMLTRTHKAATLREMGLEVVLGRLEQGFALPALAGRAVARLGFPTPLLPEVESQKIHAGLRPCQGGAHARCVALQRQAHPRQPSHPPLLPGGEDCVRRMQPQAVLGLGDAPGVRRERGDALLSPMESNQRAERRPWAALRGACCGGRERVRLHDP